MKNLSHYEDLVNTFEYLKYNYENEVITKKELNEIDYTESVIIIDRGESGDGEKNRKHINWYTAYLVKESYNQDGNEPEPEKIETQFDFYFGGDEGEEDEIHN